MTQAHHCKCDQVSRCSIFVHPSSQVQDAINKLIDTMAEFDETSGSISTLFFKSLHPGGVFTSLTSKGREV